MPTCMNRSDTPDLKHRQIFKDLIREIETGKYKESGRLPSEMQLVQRYDVSRQTVARALRDLQTEGLIERKAGAGSFLKERKGPSARNHPGNNYHLLGMLIPLLGVAELFEVISGELAGFTRARDCSLIWGGSSSNVQPHHDIQIEEADHICDEFIERSVNGVFFAPFELHANTEAVNERIAERLRKAGVAVILLDRDFRDYPFRSDFDLVCIDNFAAGYMLAEHLIKLGQRRLAFVAHRFSASTISARIAGAEQALKKAGITPPPNFAQFGSPEELGFVRKIVAGNPPDAIICGNDATAAQLLNSLAKLKIRVPEDIRVVGCDDLRTAKVVREPLTTIHQPCRDIAATAMTAMLHRISEPAAPATTYQVAPKLTVRSSCGAYLKKSSS